MSESVYNRLLALESVSVNFGAVRALVDLSLEISSGELIGIFGDNGAGKSTLVKVISGLLRPDSGSIFWGGKEVLLESPSVARGLGIETVYQDLAICPDLTASENIFLGREISYRGWRNRASMDIRCREILTSMGSDIDPHRPGRQLSGGQRQAVALARVFLSQPRLVLLDEPTAAISVRQVRELLSLINRLRQNGVAVLVISHRLAEVFEIADRIVVLRRGHKIADGPAAQTSIKVVTDLIAGHQEAN